MSNTAIQMKQPSSVVNSVTAKHLSVCTGNGFPNNNGYIQYREGKPGDVELTFPVEREHSSAQFLLKTALYSGGWKTLLTFTKEKARYEVYDIAIKETISEKTFMTGVKISKDGKVLSNQACQHNTHQLGGLNNLLGDLPMQDLEE